MRSTLSSTQFLAEVESRADAAAHLSLCCVMGLLVTVLAAGAAYLIGRGLGVSKRSAVAWAGGSFAAVGGGVLVVIQILISLNLL
jgi:hypothetical protein